MSQSCSLSDLLGPRFRPREKTLPLHKDTLRLLTSGRRSNADREERTVLDLSDRVFAGGTMAVVARHLRQDPDLLYLLRDYDTVYRHGSAGGSAAIRRHLRRVRETISDVLDENPLLVDREASELPVVAHLPRALDAASTGPLARLSSSVGRVAHRLTWEYGYEKVPRGLLEKYAFCEVVGPRGPVEASGLILGLVLFAPATVYPQHYHHDIEESYVAVSGAWSENDAAVYAPGSLILNRAAHAHRITTGSYTPCLLAYAWIGPPERLREPDMNFRPSGPRRAG